MSAVRVEYNSHTPAFRIRFTLLLISEFRLQSEPFVPSARLLFIQSYRPSEEDRFNSQTYVI